MAQRRMLSLKIVDTDAFLDMPLSSQVLYFHLTMRADDDGFVSNPKKIMRMIGSQNDDYKILITKRFIIPFENGVCVIKHWLIHNLIRSDRYITTQWIKEKSQLSIDPKTKKYSLNEGENNVIPNDNQMATQVRLGKVRLGKVRDTSEQSSREKDIVEVIEAFKDINPSYKKYFGNKTQRAATERLIKEHGKVKILSVIEFLLKSNKEKYAPTITTPLQLEDKLGALIAWSEKLKVKTKEFII